MSIQPIRAGDGGHVFAIRQMPDAQGRGVSVVILNAGVLHSAGPFRLHIALSNRLSRLGFPVFRVDQSGKGETPRRPGMTRADTVLADYDAIYEAVQQVGLEKVVLIGLCWGADDAIYVASQRDSVAGIVALDGFAMRNAGFHLRHYGRRLFSPAAWLRKIGSLGRRMKRSEAAASDNESVNDFSLRDWAAFDEMVRRHVVALNNGTRFLGVFSRGQNYYNHVGQLAENLKGGCDTSHLTEVYFDDADHTFSLTKHRERLLDTIEHWISSEFEPRGQDA